MNYDEKTPSDVEPNSTWDPDDPLVPAEETTEAKRKTPEQILAELELWFKKWDRPSMMMAEFKEIFWG